MATIELILFIPIPTLATILLDLVKGGENQFYTYKPRPELTVTNMLDRPMPLLFLHENGLLPTDNSRGDQLALKTKGNTQTCLHRVKPSVVLKCQVRSL